MVTEEQIHTLRVFNSKNSGIKSYYKRKLERIMAEIQIDEDEKLKSVDKQRNEFLEKEGLTDSIQLAYTVSIKAQYPDTIYSEKWQKYARDGISDAIKMIDRP